MPREDQKPETYDPPKRTSNEPSPSITTTADFWYWFREFSAIIPDFTFYEFRENWEQTFRIVRVLRLHFFKSANFQRVGLQLSEICNTIQM